MKSTLLLALLLGFAASASAQHDTRTTPRTADGRFGMEFRSGAGFATAKLGDADLRTGFGFEATLTYRFLPHTSAYAGWGWHSFSAAESFAGADTEFEETGYTVGLQFAHPLGETGLQYLVRGGLLLNHIEVENTDGDIFADTKHGAGWQIEGGLSIPLSRGMQLLPSVRYRALSRDLRIGDVTTALDLRYLSVGAGLAWTF